MDLPESVFARGDGEGEMTMVTWQIGSTASTCWIEHQILEHVKQALRVTLEWKAPAVSLPQKMSSVAFTLKSFQRHLDRLMAIEEEGGYMAMVSEVNPHLQERIDYLAHDHDRFRQQIGNIVPCVEELCEWQPVEFAEICAEIFLLLDEVDSHDEQEISLLQDSLLLDDGGEG
jgi:hypothetical protein